MTADAARTRRRARSPRLPALLAIVLAAAALAVTGVPGAPGVRGAPDSPAAAAPAPATAPVQVTERFTGTLDEFYVVPDPLPPGAPGELIRVQDASSGDGTTTLRIMYHSRDAADRDRAVTGIVTFPDGPAPDGGWPVVSVAPGTVGLASRCAPSRNSGAQFSFGIEGVAVRTDYIGMGPVGEHQAYLSRPSEAHSVIDAVRAARNLPEAHAGDRWVALGNSQGGHAAIATNELAEEYAPELDLRGTVAGAPAALFDRTYGPLDEIVTRIVGVMALYGATTEHPEIVFEHYAGPRTLAAAEATFHDQCLDAIISAFAVIPAHEFWSTDPIETEPARSIMLANDVGGVAVDSPLMLVTGTADDRVVIERARAIYDVLCAAGQVTEYVEHEGGTHGDIIARSLPQITAFFEARLAGGEPTDSCPDDGPPPTSPTTAPPEPVAPDSPDPAARPVAPPAVAVVATPTYTG